MRYFLLIILISFLWATTAQPLHFEDQNDGDVEDTEYASNEDTPTDDSMQEEEANLNEQELTDNDQEEETPKGQQTMNKDKLARRFRNNDHPSNDNYNVEEYSRKKNSGEESDWNIKRTLQHQKLFDNLVENAEENEQSEDLQPFINHFKIKNNEPGEGRNNELEKRERTSVQSKTQSHDYDDNIFNSQNSHENNEYNNAGSNEQSRHIKEYTMQSNHRNMLRDRNYEVNRDRRQAEQSDTNNVPSTSTEKQTAPDSKMNEDDEAAIKRHIKKLSSEELEELLNSLTDDKKALLNKIIESTQSYDYLIKREITKKSGALEENSYNEGSMSELNKDQGISSVIDINTEPAIVQTSDADSSKQESQTDASEINNTKTSDSTRGDAADNKAELTNAEDQTTNNIKLDVNLNNEEKNIASSNVQVAKINSKRDTNNYFNDFSESLNSELLDNESNNVRVFDDPFIDRAHVCPSEDLSNLIDEESQLHNNNGYKREALLDIDAELDDSFKSLEESFPNNHCEETGQYQGSNMAPLIRVKRKNEKSAIKKRSDVLPNAKVAYFPYKAENGDEDNDEGNEFDDEGFYDRISNYAKSNDNKADDSIVPLNYIDSSGDVQSKKDMNDEQLSDHSSNNRISNAASLGSDTDSVLSGVEGVDDNLMFNSGSRSRRTLDKLEGISTDRPLLSSASPSEPLKLAETYINVPHYQENDSFGGLPRNYDSELGRYKRIRRVKQSPAEETVDI